MRTQVLQWWWIAVLVIFACVLVGRVETYESVRKIDAGAAISNAQNARAGEFPFIVKIKMDNDRTGYHAHATGFLITPRHVMTSAHKIMEAGAAARFTLFIGGIRTDGTDGEVRIVKSISLGPFTQNPIRRENDYAVMFFETPSFHAPVRVNGLNASVPLKAGQPVTLAGFGSTSVLLEPTKWPEFLQKGVFSIKSFTAGVIKTSRNSTPDHSTSLLFFSGSMNVGDDGAPLLTKTPSGWVAVGIASGPEDEKTMAFCDTKYAISRLFKLSAADAPSYAAAARACVFTGRQLQGGRWKCPVTHPWDAGVVDQADMPEWRGKQCGKTAACANQLHFYYIASGKNANPPRHRNA